MTRYLIPWDDDTDEMVVIENSTDAAAHGYQSADDDDDAFRDLVYADYDEDDEMTDDNEVEIDIMDE